MMIEDESQLCDCLDVFTNEDYDSLDSVDWRTKRYSKKTDLASKISMLKDEHLIEFDSNQSKNVLSESVHLP